MSAIYRELNLDIAERAVNEYRECVDEVMHNHAQVKECWACEDTLDAGIKAYEWLRNAEKVLREADYRGIRTFSEEEQEAVREMYLSWLETRKRVEPWIADLSERGYPPENLAKFREVQEEVEDIAERKELASYAAEAQDRLEVDEPW